MTGVAQIDCYELLFTSEDDAEGGYGEEISPSDFKYIGYRVVEPQGQAGTCDYLLEFSFTTWVSTSNEGTQIQVKILWLTIRDCIVSILNRRSKSASTWSSFR